MANQIYPEPRGLKKWIQAFKNYEVFYLYKTFKIIRTIHTKGKHVYPSVKVICILCYYIFLFMENNYTNNSRVSKPHMSLLLIVLSYVKYCVNTICILTCNYISLFLEKNYTNNFIMSKSHTFMHLFVITYKHYSNITCHNFNLSKVTYLHTIQSSTMSKIQSLFNLSYLNFRAK